MLMFRRIEIPLALHLLARATLCDLDFFGHLRSWIVIDALRSIFRIPRQDGRVVRLVLVAVSFFLSGKMLDPLCREFLTPPLLEFSQMRWSETHVIKLAVREKRDGFIQRPLSLPLSWKVEAGTLTGRGLVSLSALARST